MSDATIRIRLVRGCSQACLHCPDSARYRPLVEPMRMDALAAGLASAFARVEPSRALVIVTGGEPGEHPQLLDALALVHAHRPARTKLATNGVRLAGDPDVAARALELGVTDLLLSADVAAPWLRDPSHAAAVARVVAWARGRARIALNAMVFGAPLARVVPALERLLALAPDDLRLLRFDPSEVPAAPRLAPPTDEQWRALRRWAAQRGARIALVDRQRNLETRAARTIELAA